MEGEAELSEQKAAKDAERNDSADASENIEEAKNHKGEAKQEVAAMETPTQVVLPSHSSCHSHTYMAE